MEAIFRYGDNIQTMDHTPGSAVDAGDVVLVGQIVGVSLLDIAANVKGALNIYGGVYTMIGDDAIAAGVNVYWDASEGKISATSTGNKFFGVTLTACAADDGTCDVAHLPSSTVPPGSGG